MIGQEQKQVCVRDGDSVLPDCLLVEILVRLPLKSFFKFKAVSKYWLSLISDPSFAQYYESQINKGRLPSPSKPWILLLSRCNSRHDIGDCIAVNQFPAGCDSSGFSLSFLPTKLKDHRMTVVASHNGLLLCGQISDVSYFVCNPLTKHYVALPKLPREFGYFDAGFVCQDDGNYKVVRLRSSMEKLKLHIFASETGNWQDLNLSRPVCREPRCYRFNQCPLVTYKGILHWIECSRSSGLYSAHIIAYDPCRNSHQVHLMDLPSDRNSRHIFQRLAVCCDNLCCLETSRTLGNESLKLRVLSNYERGEWHLKHEIKYTGDILSDHNFMKTCFIETSRLVMHPFDLDIVYARCDDGLVSYNFQTRKRELIRSDRRLVTARAHIFVSWPWPRMIAQASWEPIRC